VISEEPPASSSVVEVTSTQKKSQSSQVETQKQVWEKENSNNALKDYCKKHYQPILKIIDPDFALACTRCLRETFLKRDQDTLKA